MSERPAQPWLDIEKLQKRLNELEAENKRLREKVKYLEPVVSIHLTDCVGLKGGE